MNVGPPPHLQLHELNAYRVGKGQSGVCIQSHGRAIAAAWLRTEDDNVCLQPSPSNMQTAKEHMVPQMRREQGWRSLHQDMLRSMPLFR